MIKFYALLQYLEFLVIFSNFIGYTCDVFNYVRGVLQFVRYILCFESVSISWIDHRIPLFKSHLIIHRSASYLSGMILCRFIPPIKVSSKRKCFPVGMSQIDVAMSRNELRFSTFSIIISMSI